MGLSSRIWLISWSYSRSSVIRLPPLAPSVAVRVLSSCSGNSPVVLASFNAPSTQSFTSWATCVVSPFKLSLAKCCSINSMRSFSPWALASLACFKVSNACTALATLVLISSTSLAAAFSSILVCNASIPCLISTPKFSVLSLMINSLYWLMVATAKQSSQLLADQHHTGGLFNAFNCT